MTVSNDWPVGEQFGGGGSYGCIIDICEHSVDLYKCKICLESVPEVKKKSKLQIVTLAILSPLYLLFLLVCGVAAIFSFLTNGGLFGLMIIGWTVSGIYHFFFVVIPYIFNFLF